ncbi:MAG: hypothetical protein ACTS73_09845 [Arsenophonus sp. NEOnobi-MAG3]
MNNIIPDVNKRSNEKTLYFLTAPCKIDLRDLPVGPACSRNTRIAEITRNMPVFLPYQ